MITPLNAVPTWGLYYWRIFIYVVSAMFLIPETIAFFTNAKNTLSDFAWFELGITARVNPHDPSWWLSLIAWWAFVGIITAHIWFVTPS